MANREDLRAEIYRDLRDPDGKSWNEQEINDLINSGINAVSSISPREYDDTFYYSIIGDNYDFGQPKAIEIPMTHVFRVEVIDTNNMVREILPPDNGNGSSSGWSVWNGNLLLPERYNYPIVNAMGDKIKVRVYGYARHALLEDDETETTMNDQEQQACRSYAVAFALSRLMIDRANFQQWQIASGASDTSISELAVLANAARQRWYEERGRLRKMRRLA